MSRRGFVWVILPATLCLTACMHAAQLFLDLPEEEVGDSGVRQVPAGVDAALPDPAPAIETVTDPDRALALLPTDSVGRIDWVAAWRSGVIRPRPGIEARPDSSRGFGYDHYIGRGKGPEAYFPHSTHGAWLTCGSCHPRLYRGSEALRPATAHEPSSCGACHGPVAFPIQACGRCHEDVADEPNGIHRGGLGAWTVLERARSDSGAGSRFEGMDVTTLYPPARFPHAVHRMRYQCRVCHSEPFSMARGGTVFSESEAHSEGACGLCHDGSTAFAVSIDLCFRCHVEGDG